MTNTLVSRAEQVKPIFAKYVSSILPLEAKIIVIKLRPCSMLKYTLPRILECFKNFAVSSRSGDIRLQSQNTLQPYISTSRRHSKILKTLLDPLQNVI